MSYYLAGAGPPGVQKSNMSATFWPDIEEALQDDLKPGPEQEFFTNALEFLRIGNMRMALIEASICLELVLSQYLNSYLRIRRGISKNRTTSFLSPNLGLTARVSVLLDLTTEKKLLDGIDIEEVLKAIGWRNHITHKTGHLPEDVPEEAIRTSISNVLMLSLKLASERTQISAEPDFQKISQKLTEKYKIPSPSFRQHKRYISVDINFLSKQLIESDYSNIIQILQAELNGIRKRFSAGEHLYVRFVKFPNRTVARWKQGQLEIIEEPPAHVKGAGPISFGGAG